MVVVEFICEAGKIIYSVSMGSMGSLEPINFSVVGFRTHKFLEETTKFSEKSVKNVEFFLPYNIPLYLARDG